MSSDVCTTATWAVSCCDVEPLRLLFGDEEPDVLLAFAGCTEVVLEHVADDGGADGAGTGAVSSSTDAPSSQSSSGSTSMTTGMPSTSTVPSAPGCMMYFLCC